jgi:hypothetical protein
VDMAHDFHISIDQEIYLSRLSHGLGFVNLNALEVGSADIIAH